MSKYIHPATTEAALRVASNLLPDDYREVVEGHGHDPLNALVVGVHNSESGYFTNPDDEICGIAGVHDGGQIWMLCTPAILSLGAVKYTVSPIKEHAGIATNGSCP